MGSRLREDVEYLFEYFSKVSPPIGHKKAKIIEKFPEDNIEVNNYKWLDFVYPYKYNDHCIQHFSFVINDMDGNFLFGFCRQTPKNSGVILSYLPCHRDFFRLLDIAVTLNTEELLQFLADLRNVKLPAFIGAPIIIPYLNGVKEFSIEIPSKNSCPSIPKDKNLTEYFGALSINNMIAVFAAMLHERPILFISKKLQRFTACVQSAIDLIYPLIWQSLFIPLLPEKSLNFLLVPMPFMVGISEDVVQRLGMNLSTFVVVHADKNEVVTQFDDLDKIPEDVVSRLKNALADELLLVGNTISLAFLRAIIELIGDYGSGLRYKNSQLTFSKELFIDKRPSSHRLFLKGFLETRMFKQFINDRLRRLNRGSDIADRFEIEAAIHNRY